MLVLCVEQSADDRDEDGDEFDPQPRRKTWYTSQLRISEPYLARCRNEVQNTVSILIKYERPSLKRLPL